MEPSLDLMFLLLDACVAAAADPNATEETRKQTRDKLRPLLVVEMPHLRAVKVAYSDTETGWVRMLTENVGVVDNTPAKSLLHYLDVVTLVDAPPLVGTGPSRLTVDRVVVQFYRHLEVLNYAGGPEAFGKLSAEAARRGLGIEGWSPGVAAVSANDELEARAILAVLEPEH